MIQFEPAAYTTLTYVDYHSKLFYSTWANGIWLCRI